METKTISSIKEWLKLVLIAVVIALFVNKGLIVNATVPTSSMESTIMVGDRIIANRLSYALDDPSRGDIVVFISQEDMGKHYVKRLIGLPNDIIIITEGVVYINGQELVEPYIVENEDVRSFGPYLVPEDKYFFLGDNRIASKDSRLWLSPFIDKDDIVGEVMFSYFPSIKKID